MTTNIQIFCMDTFTTIIDGQEFEIACKKFANEKAAGYRGVLYLDEPIPFVIQVSDDFFGMYPDDLPPAITHAIYAAVYEYDQQQPA